MGKGCEPSLENAEKAHPTNVYLYSLMAAEMERLF
jgi:hypothetical protein